jgi:hypothetical protein
VNDTNRQTWEGTGQNCKVRFLEVHSESCIRNIQISLVSAFTDVEP